MHLRVLVHVSKNICILTVAFLVDTNMPSFHIIVRPNTKYNYANVCGCKLSVYPLVLHICDEWL